MRRPFRTLFLLILVVWAFGNLTPSAAAVTIAFLVGGALLFALVWIAEGVLWLRERRMFPVRSRIRPMGR